MYDNETTANLVLRGPNHPVPELRSETIQRHPESWKPGKMAFSPPLKTVEEAKSRKEEGCGYSGRYFSMRNAAWRCLHGRVRRPFMPNQVKPHPQTWSRFIRSLNS